MISKASIQLLRDHNFGINIQPNRIAISHNKSINPLWPIASIILAVAFVPFIVFGNFEVAGLIIVLMIYPAYQMVKDLRQPKYTELNLNKNFLRVHSKLGRDKFFNLDQVQEIHLSTLDEYLDANAFRDEVVKHHFYLDMSFKNGDEKTLLIFSDAEQEGVEQLIQELNGLIKNPSMPKT